jgi:CRP-like cAMP-binding protein
MVRHQKIWALAGDIEHVLAYRDVRDWYVFEAASWALAEHRMPPERRRELWHEPLPAAVLAKRLRELPLFASVTVDELFRIAAAARQVRHDAGTLLLSEGEAPTAIHFLLDGRVTASSRDGAPRSIQSPAALGFAEALTGTPIQESVRADGLAVSLAMTADELRTLLADNTDLVSGLFTTIAETGASVGLVQPTGTTEDLEWLAASGLSPVEKILVLQRVPLFSHVSAEEMRQLADVAQTVTLETGTIVVAESAAPALWVVLAGALALENAGGAAGTAAAGDIVGAVSTMAGRSLGVTARVTAAGIALRLDREDLFELLGERPELLRQIFARMFPVEARV